MPYLIDSDVIIYTIEGIASAESLLLRLRDEGIAMSAISYMEVVDGLLGDPRWRLARERFERLVSFTPVMPFTQTEADRCAYMRATLRADGRRVRVRSLDLMIAATAIEHRLTLVTNNPADFNDIPGLALEAANITTDR